MSLLLEKGLVSTDAIDREGARVVARAWSSSEFKEQLLEDTSAAWANPDQETR